MTPYIYQRGETISLALDAVTGDPLSVTAISASDENGGTGAGPA